MKFPHRFNNQYEQNDFLKLLDKTYFWISLFFKSLLIIVFKSIPFVLISSIIVSFFGAFFFLLVIFNNTTLMPLMSFTPNPASYPKLSHQMLISGNKKELDSPFEFTSSHLLPAISEICTYGENLIANNKGFSQEEKRKFEQVLNIKIPFANLNEKELEEIQGKEIVDKTILNLLKQGGIAKTLADTIPFYQREFLFKQGDTWYTKGLSKDVLFRSNNEKYLKDFKDFIRTYCPQKSSAYHQFAYLHTNWGLLNKKGEKIVNDDIEEYKSWLFNKVEVVDKTDYKKTFSLNLLKELSNIEILKAFVSGKYFLTKTNSQENEYTTDPVYDYMLISNPFVQNTVETKVEKYDSLQDFFLDFNETIIDKKEKENQLLQHIDITKETIKMGYRGNKPIIVFAYDEKNVSGFIQKMQIVVSREKGKHEQQIKGFSKDSYKVEICIKDPLSIENKTPFLINGKQIAFSQKEYYQLCAYFKNVFLNEKLHIDKDGTVLINQLRESFGRSRKLKFQLKLLPYIPKGSGSWSLVKNDIYFANLIKSLDIGTQYGNKIVLKEKDKDEKNEKKIIGYCLSETIIQNKEYQNYQHHYQLGKVNEKYLPILGNKKGQDTYSLSGKQGEGWNLPITEFHKQKINHNCYYPEKKKEKIEDTFSPNLKTIYQSLENNLFFSFSNPRLQYYYELLLKEEEENKKIFNQFLINNLIQKNKFMKQFQLSKDFIFGVDSGKLLQELQEAYSHTGDEHPISFTESKVKQYIQSEILSTLVEQEKSIQLINKLLFFDYKEWNKSIQKEKEELQFEWNKTYKNTMKQLKENQELENKENEEKSKLNLEEKIIKETLGRFSEVFVLPKSSKLQTLKKITQEQKDKLILLLNTLPKVDLEKSIEKLSDNIKKKEETNEQEVSNIENKKEDEFNGEKPDDNGEKNIKDIIKSFEEREQERQDEEKNKEIQESVDVIEEESYLFSILNPYINYIPFEEQELKGLHSHISINPLLTLFKQIPEGEEIDTSKEDLASLEKIFNSFLIYSNVNHQTLLKPLSENIPELLLDSYGEIEKVEHDNVEIQLEKKEELEINKINLFKAYSKSLLPSIHYELKKQIENSQENQNNDEESKQHQWTTFFKEDLYEMYKSKGYKKIEGEIIKSLNSFKVEEIPFENISDGIKRIADIWFIEDAYTLSSNNGENFLNSLPLENENAKEGVKLFFKDMQSLKTRKTFNQHDGIQTALLQRNSLIETLLDYMNKGFALEKDVKNELNPIEKLFNAYFYEYQNISKMGIPVQQNLILLHLLLKEHKYTGLDNLSKEEYQQKIMDVKEYIEHTAKIKKNISILTQISSNLQIDEVNEKIIADSYTFGELFKMKNPLLLSDFIISKNPYLSDANEYLALNGENYPSIIAYNYYSFVEEEEHFKSIFSSLKGIRDHASGFSNEAIQRINWDWFVGGLDNIHCKDASECETMVQRVKKLKNWDEFKTYIHQLIGEVKTGLQSTVEGSEREEDLKNTLNALKDLLDSYLHFAEKPQVTDIWDIVDFWSDDIFACDKAGGTPEQIRDCKLKKVRYGRFNLSSAYSSSVNGLTGQCVRGANMLNKFFNKGLESCRYSLDGGDQWASYGALTYGRYDTIHIGRGPRSRNRVSCNQRVIYHAGKTFGSSPDDIPRFCPVVPSKQAVFDGKIKENMIAVVHGEGWGSYGHVVYIGGVERETGKVGVAETNYKRNLALSGSIDSLTVRQSLQPVEKFKIYFDLDRPFSLNEVKNIMGLESVGQVNNDIIQQYCDNYTLYN